MSQADDSELSKPVVAEFGAMRPALLFAALLCVLLTIYWLPLLTGHSALFVSDHTYYFEPFARFIGESFRHFKLPLWNPYLYCGMSQAAVPSPGIFYPGSLLFALGSYSQAVAGQMLLHQLLAGFGMFLLISSFGWGWAPSAVAGLVISLTGYMFALTTNCTIAFSASCLPIVLWSFRSIAHATHAGQVARRWLFMFVACCSIFLFIAAGRPEVFAPGVGFLIVYCLIEGLNNRKKGVETSLVFAGWRFQIFAFVTGLALTMPILLPVYEWSALSPRAKGLTPSHALMWSTNWYDFISIIYPQPFGDLLILGSKYLRLVATRTSFYPYITSLFIGPVCFSLAIWGFFDRSWLWRRWLLIALAGFIVICLGEFTPVAPYLVRTFSSLAVLRYPIKLMIFPLFLLTVAAARGTKGLLACEIGKAARLTVFIFWIFSLSTGVLFWCVGSSNHTLLFLPTLPPYAEIALGRSMVGSSIIGLVCSLVEHLYARKLVQARYMALIVVLGIAANLTAVAFCNKQMTAGGDFYKHKQTLDIWLSEQEKQTRTKSRLLNLYFDPLQTPADYRMEPESSWTENFFGYSRELLLCNTVMDSNRSQSFGYEASETGAYREMVLRAVRNSSVDRKVKPIRSVAGEPGPVAPAATDKRLLDLALLHLCQSTGTRWVTSQVYKSGEDLRFLNESYFALKKEDRKLNLRLYKLKGAAPRAYFCEHWKWVNSTSDALKASMKVPEIYHYAPLSLPQIEQGSSEFVYPSLNYLAPKIPLAPKDAPTSPYSADEEVTVDALDRATHPLNEPDRRVALQSPDSNVDVMNDNPEHLSLSSVNKKPGFLVLCDHFYPGWCVFVDSVQVPLYKVNTEMRGVYLPAGTHLVEFEFRSESLKNGVTAGACGLFLAFCFAFMACWPSVWRFVKSTAGDAV